MLLEKSPNKFILRSHYCLCPWPHIFSSMTLSLHQVEPLRGETRVRSTALSQRRPCYGSVNSTTVGSSGGGMEGVGGARRPTGTASNTLGDELQSRAQVASELTGESQASEGAACQLLLPASSQHLCCWPVLFTCPSSHRSSGLGAGGEGGGGGAGP